MTRARTKDNLVLFIAEGAYSGRSPVAPGTAGTVVGVLLYLLLKDLAPLWYLTVCAGIVLLGTGAAGAAERVLGAKDASSIVIDEIAGYLVSLAFLPFSWWAVAAAFALFRFFDILKPWPLRQLQHVRGGPGVMLDDLGAGIYTNLVLQAVSWFLVSG